MNNHLRICLLCAVCVAMSIGGGCATYRGTPQPAGTGEIPIQAWVVLNTNEFSGDPQNRGCRLSADQINDLLSKLVMNSKIFGSTTKFVYDPQLHYREINWNLNVSLSLRRFGDDIMIQIIDDNGAPRYWVPDAINLYFTGWYAPDPPGLGLYGSTIDPAGVNPFAIPYPIIIVNDGGEQSGGLGTEPWPKLLNANTLQHEVGHYLARFRNRTFDLPPGTGVRQFDSGEHANHLHGDGSSSLLRSGSRYPVPPGGVFTPYNLFLHGDEITPGTELYEVSSRIFEGRWNQP